MARTYHVFVNRESGAVDEVDRQCAEISATFHEFGAEATIGIVDAGALPDALRLAWKQGIDAVVVAGGDGTVSSAAQVAVGDDMVLGVLPLGTFNHFAKDLGMRPDLGEAVRFLVDAETVRIDVGEVNDKVFVNNASIGVYPKMVGERDALRARRGWGKLRAAPVAVVRTLRGLPVHRLRLSIDGAAPESVETALLFVGNGLFDEHGERVGKRTSLDDHRLGVYLVATRSPWRLVANAFRARIGGVTAAPAMTRRDAQEMIVESEETSLQIALDGEPTDLRVPLTFRSRPGALRVLAAPDRTRGS